MIGYVTIGALDSEASGKFYDAVPGALGDERESAGDSHGLCKAMHFSWWFAQ
jgi:hypothetical protein